MAHKRAYEKLFQTGKIGDIVLRNRIVMAPMNLNFTEYPYNFSWKYINAIEERAKGGVGLIITAHVKAESQIDPYPVAGMPAALDRESNLRRFAELTEVVHRHGAKIVVQLSSGTGRLADLPMPEKWPAAPSCVPMLNRPDLFTRELSTSEISGLIEAYGKAAERARRAGFDGILVHCTASYLTGQFLSKRWNKRTDKYGGSLEARMRFMEECIGSIRSLAGNLTLLAMIATDSKIEGAPSIEEAKVIARRLEQLGIAALLLRTGSYDSKDWLIPPIYYPQGCRAPYTQPVKDVVTIPVILDGRIDSPEFAEKLLEEGKAEFIGLARPLLADPDWARKAEQGKTSEIRSCIYCNECYTRIATRRYVKCAVNPDLGKEGEFRSSPARVIKKILVAGGGPAGLRAATVAALRGHNVTLYEMSPQLGGIINAGSVPEFKRSMRPIINWLAQEAYQAGVAIELGRECTAETIRAAQPDAVVLATGSVPAIPSIAGIEGRSVTTAISALLGEAKIGTEVVVVGGGYVGCETALHFAQMGKKVSIIEMLPDIALDAGAIDRVALVGLLAEGGVKVFTDSTVEVMNTNGVVACNKDGEKHDFRGSVIMATGMNANDGLYEEIKDSVVEIHKIGDAVQPRRILDAIHEGEAVGHLL